MLTLEPPFYRVRDVTVFRDHQDPDLFYALPGRPRLAAEGDGPPRFTLYKYRRDLTDNPALDPTRAKGGGLALFEVDLPAPGGALLTSEIAGLSGRPDARIAPVLFRSGSVSTVLAHAEGDGLVEDLVERHGAPIAPPHRSAFAIALSPEGASLFEQAARGGQLPLGVIYDLRFLALTPSLHARVTMDYERIYDRFAASVGFTYYVSVKLDLDLAWLVENDFVKIEITAFTDDADAERQRDLVMRLVKARIAADFFRSGIPPKQPEAAGGPLAEMLGGLIGGGEITSATALFVLKARYEAVRERKHHELLLDGRTAIELPHTAVGLLPVLLGETADGEPAELDVQELDLDDRFFSALEVKVDSTADFESMPDLLEAVVELTRGDHRKAFPFERESSGGGTFAVPLTDPAGDLYSWTASFHFDPDLGGGPTRIEAGPFTGRDRVLVVSPLDHLRYRRLRVLRAPVDPALVPRLHVHLRVPGAEPGDDDLARAHLVLTEDRQEIVWRQRFPRELPPPRLLARTEWEDAAGTVHPGGRETEITGETLVVKGPFRDLLDLSVVPVADWTRVRQVLVELRYRDGDHRAEHRLLFDRERSEPATLAIPLLDPAKRAYEWRQTVFLIAGAAEESDWQTADRGVLAVGNEAAPPRRLRVVWVGDPGDAFGLRIDVWLITGDGGEEGPLSTFLRTGETDTAIELPAGEGTPEIRYEVRRLDSGGEMLTGSGRVRSSLLVVQGG